MRARSVGLMVTAVAGVLCATACKDKPTKHGKEGEWFTANYQREGKADTARILVEDSIAEVTEDGTVVVVFWRAENTGKEAARFDWQNKHLIDAENRMFEPTTGSHTERLQPTESSKLQFAEYALPSGISTTSLSWALVWDSGPAYQIALSPDPPPTCAEVGRKVRDVMERASEGRKQYEDLGEATELACDVRDYSPRARYCVVVFEKINGQGCCPNTGCGY